MFQLDLEQEFDVPVSELYTAWTDVEQLKAWFCPDGMEVPDAFANCHEGGDYQITMQSPDGEQHVVAGMYQKVVPMEKLILTWKWQSSPHTTVVTVLFNSISNNRSKLALNHCEFVDEESKDKHIEGWTSCLNKLKRLYG